MDILLMACWTEQLKQQSNIGKVFSLLENPANQSVIHMPKPQYVGMTMVQWEEKKPTLSKCMRKSSSMSLKCRLHLYCQFCHASYKVKNNAREQWGKYYLINCIKSMNDSISKHSWEKTGFKSNLNMIRLYSQSDMSILENIQKKQNKSRNWGLCCKTCSISHNI